MPRSNRSKLIKEKEKLYKQISKLEDKIYSIDQELDKNEQKFIGPMTKEEQIVFDYYAQVIESNINYRSRLLSLLETN